MLIVVSARDGRRARLGAEGGNQSRGGFILDQMTRRFLCAFCSFGEGLPACSSKAVRKGSGLLAMLLLDVWDR